MKARRGPFLISIGKKSQPKKNLPDFWVLPKRAAVAAETPHEAGQVMCCGKPGGARWIWSKKEGKARPSARNLCYGG